MKVLFFGGDSEYFDLLVGLSETMHFQVECIHVEENLVDLETSLNNSDIAIVFLDFTSIEDTAFDCYRTLNKWKQLTMYRRTIFTGIFASKDDFEEIREGYNSGLSFCLVKGADYSLLVSKILNLCAENETATAALAKADKSRFDLSAKIAGSLYAVNDESIVIETDIELSSTNEKVRIGLDIVDEVKISELPIIDAYDDSVSWNYNYTYRLEIPEAIGWNNEGEHSLTSADLENWIDNSSDILLRKKMNLFIISKNYEFVNNYNIGYFGREVESIFVDDLDARCLEDIFQLAVPQVIFYEISNDDVLNLEGLQKVIDTIKQRNINPILCVYNCKSSSESLRKVFDHQLFIASEEYLSSELFYRMADIFWNKRNQFVGTEFHYYDPTKAGRYAPLIEKISIVSMTELEIEFISHRKIPAFTHIELDLPVHCVVTNLISYDEAREREEGYLYKGIVNCLSSEESNNLRRIINQFIFNPPESVDEVLIEGILTTNSKERDDGSLDTEEKIQDVRDLALVEDDILESKKTIKRMSSYEWKKRKV